MVSSTGVTWGMLVLPLCARNGSGRLRQPALRQRLSLRMRLLHRSRFPPAVTAQRYPVNPTVVVVVVVLGGVSGSAAALHYPGTVLRVPHCKVVL